MIRRSPIRRAITYARALLMKPSRSFASTHITITVGTSLCLPLPLHAQPPMASRIRRRVVDFGVLPSQRRHFARYSQMNGYLRMLRRTVSPSSYSSIVWGRVSSNAFRSFADSTKETESVETKKDRAQRIATATLHTPTQRRESTLPMSLSPLSLSEILCNTKGTASAAASDTHTHRRDTLTMFVTEDDLTNW